MRYVSTKEEKLAVVRQTFLGVRNRNVTGYEFPQLWIEGEQAWVPFNELPLVICFGEECCSISWSKFDELAVERGRALPFSLAGNTVRWVGGGVMELDSIVGGSVKSVLLARGQMSLDGVDVEVWDRLIFVLEDGRCLEVFNALDENGLALGNCEALEGAAVCI